MMSKPRPELFGQTALRGIAALVVFIAHADYLSLFPPSAILTQITEVFHWHNESVDLFFVLSGFILCYVYQGRKFTWRDYFVSRLARIYPLYLAALLVLFVLLYYTYRMGRGLGDFTPWPVFFNIFLVQDWPFMPSINSLNFPTWSISVEAFLYIFIFPALLVLNRHLNLRQKSMLIALPVMIEAIIISFTWGRGLFGDDEVWTPFNPGRGILCFTSGFFTCSVGLELGFSNLISRRGEILFLGLIACALMFDFPFHRSMAILGFPLLAYLSAQEKSLLTRGLSGGLLAWLGHLSYSIYVWHWPILHFLTMLVNHIYSSRGLSFATYPFILMAASIGAILTISHLSHFYFERPANRWLRKKLSRGADPLPVSMR